MADASKPVHNSKDRKSYRSPAGTYEKILKSPLEDISLSDYARSVLFFAATKPEYNNAGERWVLSETALVRDMKRPAERIRRALRELRRAGYASVVTERDEHGRVKRMTTVLNREKVHVPLTAAGQEDRKVNATYQQVSDRKVKNHPVVSYPPSDNCASSDNGSVLSLERTKEHARSGLRSAPAGRAGVSLDSGEEAGVPGWGTAQRESENSAAIGAAVGHQICGCCGARRAVGWFGIRGPHRTQTMALCDGCTDAWPSAVTVTQCGPRVDHPDGGQHSPGCKCFDCIFKDEAPVAGSSIDGQAGIK